MYECDPVPADAAARFLVDELIAEFTAALERLIEIGDSKADVMDSGATAIDEFGDGAVRFRWFQKFHGGFTEIQGGDLGAVGMLERVRFESQDLAVEFQGRLNFWNRDADMCNAGSWFQGGPPVGCSGQVPGLPAPRC